MFKTFLTVFGVWVALGGAAHASDPSFDCAKASSGAEEAVCASDDLAALDREVARLYGLAARGPNMTDDRLNELRAYQRGWIKGRDDCWKSDLGLETCVAEAYALRIQDIRQGYADARAEPGASEGPYPYVCDGFQAVIGATFVTAGTPRVVLRWRDSFAILPASQSASGALYDNGTTRFWSKGDEAMFTTPDGQELTCKRDAMG